MNPVHRPSCECTTFAQPPMCALALTLHAPGWCPCGAPFFGLHTSIQLTYARSPSPPCAAPRPALRSLQRYGPCAMKRSLAFLCSAAFLFTSPLVCAWEYCFGAADCTAPEVCLPDPDLPASPRTCGFSCSTAADCPGGAGNISCSQFSQPRCVPCIGGCSAPKQCYYPRGIVECFQPCSSSADCPFGELCYASNGRSRSGYLVPAKTCAEPPTYGPITCTSTSDCPNGQACSPQGSCADCVTSTYGKLCESPRQCAYDSSNKLFFCTLPCSTTSECSVGLKCIAGFCLSPYTSSSEYLNDDGSPFGKVEGINCSSTDDCANGSPCVAGLSAPPHYLCAPFYVFNTRLPPPNCALYFS